MSASTSRTTLTSRGPDMNKLRLMRSRVRCSASSPAPAMAQDITVAVAGPMTGGQATFGRQMKNGAEQAIADINAAGGVLGQQAQARGRRRRLRSQAGPLGRRKARRQAGGRRGRALLLVVVDPGLRRLPRRRRPADHAGLDQSALHRSQHVEHVPHLRPRRPAGRLRRRLHGQAFQRQERSPSSTTRPPTAKVSPTR